MIFSLVRKELRGGDRDCILASYAVHLKIKHRKNVENASFSKDITKGYVGVSYKDAVDKESERVDG